MAALMSSRTGLTSSQAPASGADRAVAVSASEPSDRDDDEDRAAAEVDRADGGRVADPASHPGRLLVEGVEPDQEEQGREAEHDQVAELVAERRRHVADEDRPDDDDRAERPAVTEDGRRRELSGPPAQQAEDEQVVAGRAGRELPDRRSGRSRP